MQPAPVDDLEVPWSRISSTLALPPSVLQDGLEAFYSSRPPRECPKKWEHQCVARRILSNLPIKPAGAPRLVQEAFSGPGHIRVLPHAGRETPAAVNLLGSPPGAPGIRANLLGPAPQHRPGWHRRDVCRGCQVPDPRWLDQARRMELRRRRLTPRTSSGTPKLWQLLADLHRAIYANHRYLRMPSGPRVRPAQSQLSATAPKRAQAVSGIVSKTARRLTGDRGFESVSLQRRVLCEPNADEGARDRARLASGLENALGVRRSSMYSALSRRQRLPWQTPRRS
jgi:hypothetical protein